MRTVLGIGSRGTRDPNTGEELHEVCALKSKYPVPEASQFKPFAYSPRVQPAWDTNNAVLERGRQLRDALRNHPGLAKILDHLAAEPMGTLAPIFIKMNDSGAEMITWESLCDLNDDFLALDQRWPIGRICDPLNGESLPPPLLSMPLRVMVVISAFDVRGQNEEWKVIRRAAETARNGEFAIRLKLMVGDAETAAEVRAAINEGLDWVEVSHIEKTSTRVVDQIIEWAPNVLHFFCHGSAGNTAADQALELATASDYQDPQAKSGSVKINIRSLVEMTHALVNPMLLTLNCCSGGQAAKELHSIAYQMVAAKFPAAVAMVEPVAAEDAHEFTRAFYRKVFSELKRALADLRTAPHVRFEWAQTMHHVRTAIRDLHPLDGSHSREWTIPALYVRGVEPHYLGRPTTPIPDEGAAAYSQNARLIAGWLRTVRAQMSEEDRRRVMEETLTGTPKSYWPNVNGTFERD